MREFLDYRVADFMTTAPAAVRPETTLADAENIFESHDFNGLPVVDADGSLVGLLTKLDLLRAFIFTPQTIIPAYGAIMGSRVDQTMTRQPKTVPPDTPLTRILQQMVESKIKSFPVVDGDRLVGIIAREDLLRALRTAATRDEP